MLTIWFALNFSTKRSMLIPILLVQAQLQVHHKKGRSLSLFVVIT